MRVAIYARVSTPERDPAKARKQQQDTANQTLELRKYCRAMKWTIVHEYAEHASAKSGERTQFQELFSAAARRKFDAVLVWALDRFTREGVADTFTYIKKLLEHGVQFISYTEEHFRTTGPAGELMIAIAAWIAQQERIRISERTKAGLARARSKGKRLGRPARIYNRDRVADMHRSGESLGKIAGATGLSKTTVARIVMRLRKTATAAATRGKHGTSGRKRGSDETVPG